MEIVEHDGRIALQKRVPRRNSWTEAMRTAFLGHLAATCNVTRAAAAVGRSRCAAYGQKRLHPAFAAAWDAAMAEGYDRLEAELLALALGEGGDATTDFEAEPADARIDPDLAMKILARRSAEAGRSPRGTRGAICKRVPIAEVEAELLRQLAVFEKRIRRRA